MKRFPQPADTDRPADTKAPLVRFPRPWPELLPSTSLALGLLALCMPSKNLWAQESSAPPSADTTGSAPALTESSQTSTMPSWEWLGQRFILSRHKRDLDSSLDEYLPEGETPETWQQLVAVQQLTKAGEREVLGALKGSGIITEVLGKGARGCLLRVHLFPGEAQTQEGLLLLRSAEDAESKGGGLLVISYLSKPALVARELLDLRLERWTARLLAQLSMSKAVSRTGETPAPQTSPPESP